jgi:hypothetical protein
MKAFRALTAIEQLAAHLRSEVQAKTLGETLLGVNQVARGKRPHGKTFAVAEFIEGGTIGPAVK